MSKLNKKDCPEIHLLEAYISDQISSNAERENIFHHLKQCTKCRALTSELKNYYSLLHQEKTKPVLNSVFTVVNEIEKEKVVIAGILLQPHQEQNDKKSMQYQAGIVLITDESNSVDIDDLNCIPIQENEILIRAIRSQATSETTLFLYAHDEKLYRNIKLQLESDTEIFLSDDIGKIELGNVDIHSLDEQNIIITPKST